MAIRPLIKAAKQMKRESVQLFPEKEDEMARLLVQIGANKNVARVLVFLTNSTGVTSPEIEKGAGMRQSEVSIAMNCLIHLGWVQSRGRWTANRGRPVKIYHLVKPLTEIMEFIESGTRERVKQQLILLNKLNFYVG
jgi:predicted transcriptional regulator